jgi:hypothetical protein
VGVIQWVVLKVLLVYQPRMELVAVHSLAGCLMTARMARMEFLAVRGLAMLEYSADLDTLAEVKLYRGEVGDSHTIHSKHLVAPRSNLGVMWLPSLALLE